MSFDACLPVILKSEGGWYDDPRAGPTNKGVTLGTLSAYLKRPATVDDLRNISDQTVHDLYLTMYWAPAHCGELPAGVDLMVLDESINEGPGAGVMHLQRALGITTDGEFGPVTKAAVARLMPKTLIGLLHAVNAAFYAGLANESATAHADLLGWEARNDRTRDIALGMAE